METLAIIDGQKGKSPEPMPIGKILVMKSGKTVLRIGTKEGKQVDYELIKGISTNFY